MHFTPEQRQSWTETTKDSPFNRWLRNRVNRRDGTLDLHRLHILAQEYGIEAARYAHLNPGQQRMNIGNKLRVLVPEQVYNCAASASVRLPQVSAQTPAPETAPPSALAEVPTRELLGRYSAILDELRSRGVVRTGNAPLGDYAEHLFAAAFGWRLANNSASGHDAVDAAGLRFQIKARRMRSGGPGERQLGILRRLPELHFDYLAAALFSNDFSIFRAALIPHSIVLQRSTHIAHVNGWRFILDDGVWNLPGVRDVTSSLDQAAGAS